MFADHSRGFAPALSARSLGTVFVDIEYRSEFAYKGPRRGCGGGKAPARFREHCSKGPHWGFQGKAPAKVSEHCSVSG